MNRYKGWRIYPTCNGDVWVAKQHGVTMSAADYHEIRKMVNDKEAQRAAQRKHGLDWAKLWPNV